MYVLLSNVCIVYIDVSIVWQVTYVFSFNRFPQLALALSSCKTHTCCSMSFKKVSTLCHYVTYIV